MNIKKYQDVSQCNQLQNPEELLREFHRLLTSIDVSNLKTYSAINTYNLLCGIEALLCRYETVSKQTLLVLGAADNWEQSVEYLNVLHKQAVHQDIYNPNMIVKDLSC